MTLLKSDYFRIEIHHQIQEQDGFNRLKSDYFRIEIIMTKKITIYKT